MQESSCHVALVNDRYEQAVERSGPCITPGTTWPGPPFIKDPRKDIFFAPKCDFLPLYSLNLS